MKIIERFYKTRPPVTHLRLVSDNTTHKHIAVWVNGGQIGVVCVRTEEAPGFLRLLTQQGDREAGFSVLRTDQGIKVMEEDMNVGQLLVSELGEITDLGRLLASDRKEEPRTVSSQ